MNIEQLIERSWPEWHVVTSIDRGSYGEVYLVEKRDMFGTTQSAVKVVSIPKNQEEVNALRSERLSRDSIVTYMEQQVMDLGAEIRVMEKVKAHTNIVSILDYKIVPQPEIPQWHIMIRMALLTTLRRRRIIKPLSVDEVIQMGIDLCTALAICRKHNIVHRDIKPENIFISDSGDFKLGDFGVARVLERVTERLTHVGSYNYMAPEMALKTINEADIDKAALVDIYSLGIVMYAQLNNGRIPFIPVNGTYTEEERNAALSKRFHGQPLPRPSRGPKALHDIILKAAAFRPEQRYASAEEMLEALIQFKKDKENEVEKGKGKRKRRRKRKGNLSKDPVTGMLVKAIVALVILLALLLAFALWPKPATVNTERAALPLVQEVNAESSHKTAYSLRLR